MKKLFTLLFASVMAFSGFNALAADGYKSMVIHKTDGTALAVTMENDMDLKFENANFHLTSSKGEIIIPAEDVSKWTFSTEPGSSAEWAGIENITVAQVSVTVLPQRVIIENLPSNSLITLVNIDGQLIRSLKASGHCELDLADIQGGIYVLTYNNKSIKIIAGR